MMFDEVLDQVRELLQRRGRVTYRALKRRFALDDEYLEDLKGELIKAEGVAAEETGEGVDWIGQTREKETEKEQIASSAARRQTSDPSQDAAERRQLTVMFCDLVGSTFLSTQLDPEELREVIQTYRETCASVLRRFGGYLAK